MKTVRVRIAVAVTDEAYSARGFGWIKKSGPNKGQPKKLQRNEVSNLAWDAIDEADRLGGLGAMKPRVVWVETDVPLPTEPVIRGDVEGVCDDNA